jgi:Flp pilus assembly protein TadD
MKASLRLVGAAIVAALVLVACSGDPESKSQKYLANGDALAAKGSLNEAIVEYRNAVQTASGSSTARKKLAEAYQKAGNLDGAAMEFSVAADLLPEDLPTQLAAARSCLLAGRFDDAGGRSDKVLKLDPSNIEAQVIKGHALAGLKNLEGAIAQVESAIRLDPSRPLSYANLGGLQVAKGDLKAAEAAFKKALALSPEAIPARLALANLAWVTGQTAEAEAHVKAALAVDPSDFLANRALSYLYLLTGRVAEAEAPLKMLAETRPEPDGWLTLADYYIVARRLEDARTLLEKIAQDPVPSAAANARLRLAYLGLWAGNRQEAQRLIDEILARDQSHVEALVARAQLLLVDGKSQDALNASRAAVKTDAASPQAQYVLGRSLMAERQYDEAAAAHRAALKSNPRFAPAHVELARLALRDGKPRDAVVFARDAVRFEPGYADAHLMLAHAEIATGNPVGAERSLQLLVSRLPESPAVQGELGKLLSAKGDLAGARTAFNRALAKDPAELNALAGLIALELREKKPAAARARIDSAVSAYPGNAPIALLAAQTYTATGDDGGAERILKQVLAEHPNELEAYAQLATMYVRQRKLGAAVAEFDRSAERQPTAVEPRTAAAILTHIQGDVNGAQARYVKVLEVDRNAAVAANNLAQIYSDRNENLDVALQLAQTAKAGLPKSHEVDDTLGWIYYKKGNGNMAVTFLKQAAAAQPANAIYQYHLGAAHALNNDKINARQALDKALRLQSSFDGADDARKILESVK